MPVASGARLAGAILFAHSAGSDQAHDLVRTHTPWPYIVTRDGQRFLVSVDMSQQASETPLTVVVN
jgi:hypothetical protein